MDAEGGENGPSWPWALGRTRKTTRCIGGSPALMHRVLVSRADESVEHHTIASGPAGGGIGAPRRIRSSRTLHCSCDRHGPRVLRMSGVCACVHCPSQVLAGGGSA